MQTKQQAVDAIVSANTANISTWKQAYNKVKAIAFDTVFKGEPQTHAFIICSPTRPVLDAYKKYNHEGKTKEIDNLLLGSCLLAGDSKVLDEQVDVRISVLGSITDLITVLEAEEKEL